MAEAVSRSREPGASAPRRDYSMFDAELTGAVMNLSLLRRLMRWMRPYRVTLAVSALLVIVASALQILLPVVISLVGIDYVIGGRTDGGTPDMGMVDLTVAISEGLGLPPLLAACCLYVALQLAWAVTVHAHRMTLITSVIKGLRDLRLDLFRHLETRPSSFYDRVAVGRVMTRVTNDIEALYELLRGLGTLIGEFAPFLVALVIMFSVNVKLTCILLLALPVIAVVTFYFRRATRLLFRMVRLSVSALNQNLQENLAGLQVVQLSRRENYNYARYTDINQRNLAAETKSMRLETAYGAFTDSMASIAIGAVLWFGGGDVVQEEMTLGGVVLFTQFIAMLFHPIVVLGEQLNVLFRAMASGERIFQALDWDEKIHEPASPVTLPARLRGEVRFRRLDFGYDPDVPVLKDVSLTISAGEKLAIVGPTGSGKSTLVKLLGRFYDFDDGRIFLDDIDLNHIHSRDLRRRIGVVLQDFHIFSGTIHDNVLMRGASPSRSPAEGSFMRGASPSRSPAEGSFMRGASPSRSPAEGSFMRGAGPSRSPAEGSLMRGASPSRSPAEGSLMRGASPSRSPAEGSFMRGASPSRSPAADRERVVAAARTVNAHDFIAALPKGYDTPLSERGQNLSQGQRQLLAFARVLAADPEILILDEATASIDTETELLIQDALRKLTAGRTSIIIAHRLQTIQEADRVLVLDGGQVAEVGTHEELLAARGLYFTLHELQFQETDAAT